MATKQDLAILNSVFNPLVPIGECPIEEIVDEELKDEEELTDAVIEAKKYELEAVNLAETGKVEEAILVLTRAIQVAPKRASCYNNRAQAFRLKGDIQAALQDLTNAIRHSEGHGRSACLSFCQRALIHRFQGRDQEAKEDFKRAAALGSSFARAQLVQMNPYAALCNQMLRRVLEQYK